LPLIVPLIITAAIAGKAYGLQRLASGGGGARGKLCGGLRLKRAGGEKLENIR
jgi:hypothetical protein